MQTSESKETLLPSFIESSYLSSLRPRVGWHARVFAFAMARHARVGADSPARVLPKDVFHLIASFVPRRGTVFMLGGSVLAEGSDSEESEDYWDRKFQLQSCVYRLLPNSDEWERLVEADAPTPFHRATAFVRGKEVWVFGACTGTDTRQSLDHSCDAFVFSTDTMTWETVPDVFELQERRFALFYRCDDVVYVVSEDGPPEAFDMSTRSPCNYRLPQIPSIPDSLNFCSGGMIGESIACCVSLRRTTAVEERRIIRHWKMFVFVCDLRADDLKWHEIATIDDQICDMTVFVDNEWLCMLGGINCQECDTCSWPVRDIRLLNLSSGRVFHTEDVLPFAARGMSVFRDVGRFQFTLMGAIGGVDNQNGRSFDQKKAWVWELGATKQVREIDRLIPILRYASIVQLNDDQ